MTIPNDVPDDAGAEWLEPLTPDGQPTGERKRRAEVHRDGDWHRSFHLWIASGPDTVLVQRRSRGKDLEPGKLDVTVGGHFRAGESLEDVLREVEEEIGLFVRLEQLHHLGARQVERRYPQATDREVQEVYALRRDAPLEDYYLDCREVAVLYETSLPGLIRLCREGGHLAASGFDCQQRVSNALLVPDDLLSQGREDMAASLEMLREWLQE
jgi:isopentenyldiphosphate isomerase